MMTVVIALVIGIAVLCGDLYYLMKEKDDRESGKIYLAAVLAGAGKPLSAVFDKMRHDICDDIMRFYVK